MTITTGHKLENGASVVAARRAPKYDTRDSQAIVVLALWRDELVTWIAAADGSGTTWGHYFPGADFPAAVEDFNTRA